MSEDRKQQILDVINRELKANGRLDPIPLAGAIDAALGADTLEANASPADVNGPSDPGSSPKAGRYKGADEGKTPDQLNASNDE